MNATSDNKRASGSVTLRPNPRLSTRTSDTRWTLGEIARKEGSKWIWDWLGELLAQ